jgi:hypothetical protein
MAFFFDERANEKQREALQMIFTGKAGGFMGEFAKLFEEIRGVEFAPIKVEIAKDLAHWRAEIPGKVVARAEALTGPITRLAKECRHLTPREARPDRALSRRGAGLWPMRWTPWAFTGTGRANRASTSRLN